jgi:SAM-dependent methyltransferase
MSMAADDALFPERFVPGEMHGLIEAEHLTRYLWASNVVAGQRVLDAGCGVGYGSMILRDAGATHVTGVDIAQDAVAAAHERAQGNVEFIQADVAAMPLEDSSYDVVVCFEAIEHLQNQEGALDELRRVLTPTGLLLISSPNRHVYEEGNPHHTREYTPEELCTALRKRFANVALKRQQAWLASMICNDGVLAEADPGQPLGVDLRKVERLSPGEETFTLALASDAELPEPGSLAMLTDLDELASWRRRARSAEEHLARSEQGTREVAAAYTTAQSGKESALEDLERSREDLEQCRQALEQCRQAQIRAERDLNRSRTLLAERNAALRLAGEELTARRLRTEELEARLRASSATVTGLTRSASWRVTAPLRALKRALGR